MWDLEDIENGSENNLSSIEWKEDIDNKYKVPFNFELNINFKNRKQRDWFARQLLKDDVCWEFELYGFDWDKDFPPSIKVSGHWGDNLIRFGELLSQIDKVGD